MYSGVCVGFCGCLLSLRYGYCDVSAVWMRVARDRDEACEVLGAELICVETWTA